MAKLLQAVNKYGPKIELKKTAGLDKLADWMSMRIGLNKSEVMMVFQEMSEAILNFNKEGTPVKMPGVGTFTPAIDRHGNLKVNFLADKALKTGLNIPGAFDGEISNRGNIGLSNDAYKALWDTDNPGDPLEIPA